MEAFEPGGEWYSCRGEGRSGPVCGCWVEGREVQGLEVISSLSVFKLFPKLPPPRTSCVGQGPDPPRSPAWSPGPQGASGLCDLGQGPVLRP